MLAGTKTRPCRVLASSPAARLLWLKDSAEEIKGIKGNWLAVGTPAKPSPVTLCDHRVSLVGQTRQERGGLLNGLGVTPFPGLHPAYLHPQTSLPKPKDEQVRCAADLVLAIVTLAHAFCRLHLEAVRAQEGGCAAAAAAAARTRGRGQYREEGVAG